MCYIRALLIYIFDETFPLEKPNFPLTFLPKKSGFFDLFWKCVADDFPVTVEGGFITPSLPSFHKHYFLSQIYPSRCSLPSPTLLPIPLLRPFLPPLPRYFH